MKLLELSSRIHQSLGNPDDIAVGVILYNLRYNIGALNNLIHSSYTINTSTGDIDQEMSEEDAAILMYHYFVLYYDKKLNDALIAASVDSVIEVSENGATIRRVNKNETSRLWLERKRDAEKRLMDLINSYKFNNATPLQVAGKDTVEGFYDSDFDSSSRIS